MIAVAHLAAVLAFTARAPKLVPPASIALRRRVAAASASASSFDELRNLNTRLDRLAALGQRSLDSFYDHGTRCFAIAPGASRVSCTSTVFGLLAIDADPSSYREGGAQRVRACLEALLLDAEWRENDVFQAVLVVCALRLLDPSTTLVHEHVHIRSRVAASVGSMLASRPQRRAGRHQPLSAYLRFWMAYASSLLLNPSSGDAEPFLDPRIPPEALPMNAPREAQLTLERACESAYDDVCRQLAFHSAGDAVSFDVVVLAYSLLTYVRVLETLGRQERAARERDSSARDAVGTGSTLPPRNERIIRAALALIFEEMDTGGLWPAGQPIVLSRGAGNNVGNAYMFTPDLLASLLEVLPSSAFLPHIGRIEQHVGWLEEHVNEEVLPSGTKLVGWRSNHLPPEGGPLGWCTAQAVRCISRVRRLSRELLNADVLRELGGTPGAAPDVSAWARLLDSDLPTACSIPAAAAAASSGGEAGGEAGVGVGGEAGGDVADDGCEVVGVGPITLKATIEQRMIDPLAGLSGADALGRVATGGRRDPACAAAASLASLEAAASYSAILFGPPGTAKTTVVAAIARRLGWGLVVVDTSTFLHDGMSNVASRISYVFDRLLELEETVVLFDEIEEFILDRSIPSLAMESRMLTTAMLTKLADLRGGRRVAFFIATNRLTALDAAVTRPGRFDLQLFVGTPNLPSRMGRFRAKLAEAGVPKGSATAAAAGEAFEALLARRWEADACFLTFLETERLAADAAALASAPAADAAAFATAFEGLLDAQVVTMTVRGAVRDDFVESRVLSRV